MRYSSWQRSTQFSYFPPGVKWLLISNISLFVLYFLMVRADMGDWFRLLALAPRAVLSYFAVWQLVTYMFLHDPLGFGHILFNMLSLWMFGADLERDWGTRRFLTYYFLCGIGAGICDVVFNALFGSLDTRTIGASGAIYGLLLAFGMLYPDRIVLFNFLFPIKAKYFVMILGAIAFLSSVGGSNGISHIAHLGGMAFGFGYLKNRYLRWDFRWIGRELAEWRARRNRKRFEVYLKKQGRGPWVN